MTPTSSRAIATTHMRIGAFVDQHGPLDEVIERFARTAALGIRTLWCTQTFDYDTLALLALVGREVDDVELGTAALQVFPIHPLALARQVLTTSAACYGRLLLGIGPSHRPAMEGMFRISHAESARRMEEYLSILLPLLHGEDVDYQGVTYGASTASIHGYRSDHLSARYGSGRATPSIDVPGAEAPTVVLAALGPRMLRLAGERCDGAIAWMTGPELTRDGIVPAVRAAAGSGTPRIMVGNRVCVTDRPDEVRHELAQSGEASDALPSYAIVLERQGAANMGDVAIVGDERAVTRDLERMAEAGATDFLVQPIGSPEEQRRTLELVASVSTDAR